MDRRSKNLRKTVIRMIGAGNRGHLGPAMSLIEILRVLYDDILDVDSNDPEKYDRDRCILSKGHGCLALYSLLYDKGFISEMDLDRFCHFDGILGGHPESLKVPGVEFSTGSLGHGLPIGLGMALNGRYEKADHKVFVIIGDGESNEGTTWEAAMTAAKHKLDNLVVVVDYNHLQSYGEVADVLPLEPYADKWKAFGFSVLEVDGHNLEELRQSFRKLPFNQGKPSCIICHTVKGKGIPEAEGNPSWHHSNKVSAEMVAQLNNAVEGYDA